MTYHFTAASIAPIVGCLLTIVRSTIPLKEVFSIRKDHRIGEFNPMPFAAMILNHTGWVVYAVINTDWFIFSAESTGLLCGIWVTFSLFPLSTEKMQNRLSGLVVVAGLMYCVLALITMILNTVSPSKVNLMWSWTVSVTQVLLYAAPLSTILQAIRDRSSASFHLGLAVMGFVSSSMWTVYGSALDLQLGSMSESQPNLSLLLHSSHWFVPATVLAVLCYCCISVINGGRGHTVDSMYHTSLCSCICQCVCNQHATVHAPANRLVSCTCLKSAAALQTSKNLFILVPSLLGALLTLIALAVCGLFPRTHEPQTPAQRQQQQFRNLERAVELPVR